MTNRFVRRCAARFKAEFGRLPRNMRELVDYIDENRDPESVITGHVVSAMRAALGDGEANADEWLREALADDGVNDFVEREATSKLITFRLDEDRKLQ
jgi:hypothetical protein